MGIGAAIAGAAVVGAGASIASGNSAAKTAKNTAAANNALEASIYNQNSATLKPYVDSGNTATQELNRLLGLGDTSTYGKANEGDLAVQQQKDAISGFESSAPYQAEYDTGIKSVQAALGSKGLLDSGAAQKSLYSYGDNFLSGKLNTYEGQLAALGGQGLTAASAQAGVGQGYANSVSANNNTAATAQEDASLNTGNQINAALGSALSAYGLNAALGSSYGGTSSSALNTVRNAGAQDGVEAPSGSYWG